MGRIQHVRHRPGLAHGHGALKVEHTPARCSCCIRVVDEGFHLIVRLKARRKRRPVEHHQANVHLDAIDLSRAACEERPYLRAGNLKRGGRWIPKQAGREERQRDACRTQARRQLQRVAISGTKERLLAMAAVNPVRAHRMDDPAGIKAKRRRGNGMARWAGGHSCAGGRKRLSARRLEDGPAHTAADKQSLIGRVYDDVGLHVSDVVADNGKRHGRHPSSSAYRCWEYTARGSRKATLPAVPMSLITSNDLPSQAT